MIRTEVATAMVVTAEAIKQIWENKAVVDNQIRVKSFRGLACFVVTVLVSKGRLTLEYLAPHLQRSP